MDLLGGGGEVGVDDDAAEIAGDEQRRVFKSFAVLEKLRVSGVEVLVAALVFEGEEAAFPDIGVAVTAVELCRAFLKAEGFPRGIGFGRRGMGDEAAEIQKMLLGGGALLEFDVPPLGDECRGCHAVAIAWRAAGERQGGSGAQGRRIKKAMNLPQSRKGRKGSRRSFSLSLR
jgi:hypothetical protein